MGYTNCQESQVEPRLTVTIKSKPILLGPMRANGSPLHLLLVFYAMQLML